MTRRFDRTEDGRRRHVQTLSAIAHFPTATPPEFRSYDRLFAVADELADPRSVHGRMHQLSINGKRVAVDDSDLLAVADRFAIGTAPRVLKGIKEAFGK